MSAARIEKRNYLTNQWRVVEEIGDNKRKQLFASILSLFNQPQFSALIDTSKEETIIKIEHNIRSNKKDKTFVLKVGNQSIPIFKSNKFPKSCTRVTHLPPKK